MDFTNQTFEQFVETRWLVTCPQERAFVAQETDCPAVANASAVYIYGNGFVLHIVAGVLFYSHAWGYRAVAYTSLREAERSLYEWSREWV